MFLPEKRGEMEEVKVLLVDDEPALLEQAEIFLQKQNERLNVETAISAENGLKLLEEGDFNVVVSDYKMPKVNGLEFLETLRDQGNEIPFIIFTGKGREEVAMDALNLGANRYLKKGGSPKDQFGLLADAIIREVKLRKIEEKLAFESNLLKSLLDNTPNLIWFMDKEARYVATSKAHAEYLGVPTEEVIGKTDMDFYPEELAEKWIEDDKSIARGGEPIIKREAKVESPSRGKKIWLSTTKMPWYDENGDLRGSFGISRDITERRELEEKLKQYKRAVENSEDMYAAVDKRYTYLFANEAFLKYHQLNREGVVGHHLSEVVGEEIFEEVKPYVDRCLKGDAIHYKSTYEFPEIGERNLDLNYYPLEDEEGGIYGVVAIMKDIT